MSVKPYRLIASKPTIKKEAHSGVVDKRAHAARISRAAGALVYRSRSRRLSYNQYQRRLMPWAGAYRLRKAEIYCSEGRQIMIAKESIFQICSSAVQRNSVAKAQALHFCDHNDTLHSNRQAMQYGVTTPAASGRRIRQKSVSAAGVVPAGIP